MSVITPKEAIALGMTIALICLLVIWAKTFFNEWCKPATWWSRNRTVTTTDTETHVAEFITPPGSDTIFTEDTTGGISSVTFTPDVIGTYSFNIGGSSKNEED